jgi:hypothetical protein
MSTRKLVTSATIISLGAGNTVSGRLSPLTINSSKPRLMARIIKGAKILFDLLTFKFKKQPFQEFKILI